MFPLVGGQPPHYCPLVERHHGMSWGVCWTFPPLCFWHHRSECKYDTMFAQIRSESPKKCCVMLLYLLHSTNVFVSFQTKVEICADVFSCQTATVPRGSLCFPHDCMGRASPGWWQAWRNMGPPCCSSETQRGMFSGALLPMPGRSNHSSRVSDRPSSI